LPARKRTVSLLDATAPHDAERIQRVARLLRDRMGAHGRLPPRVAQLRPVRCAAGAGGRALDLATPRAPGVAAAEGTLPARQPLALQPEVLPTLGAAVRGVRAAARPPPRRDRSPGGGGVPALHRTGPRVTWRIAAGLALALLSAGALNWSYFVQH